VTVLAAAVCPHPPLLVPAVAAGAWPELEDVRIACVDVVRRLIDLAPAVVVVVGDAPLSIDADETAGGSFSEFGVDARVGAVEQDRPTLPLALAVGAWLLDQAGWTGRRRYLGFADTTTGAAAAAVGASLVVGADPVSVLVMGDGSARRSVTAPGYLDSRAALFDATAASAFATADASVLLSLDPGLAIELLAAGRASWQVLGGLIDADTTSGRRDWTGDLIVDTAPYGVGYLVAIAFPEPAAV